MLVLAALIAIGATLAVSTAGQAYIDILGDMAKRNLAEVFLSITTLDKDLARAMEPRASAPHRQLETIRALPDEWFGR